MQTRRRRQQHRTVTQGFTLLEVLVSILVLAIGVVGMVGLQAASMQANRDARQQSQAVRFASELGEMMRGNKDIAIQTIAANNPYLVASAFTGTTSDFAGRPDINCRGQICTSLQLAQSDMRDWLTRARDALPGIRVIVCFDTAPYDAGGLPQWNCTNDGGLAVVKIGWTRQATARRGQAVNGDDSNAAGLVEATTRPSVVMPVIAGNV